MVASMNSHPRNDKAPGQGCFVGKANQTRRNLNTAIRLKSLIVRGLLKYFLDSAPLLI